MRIPAIVLSLAMLALGQLQSTIGSSAAAPLPATRPAEHVTMGRGVTTGPLASQEPSAASLEALKVQRLKTAAGRAAAAQAAAGASLEFLTRPYTTWHVITSVFDHCNPDYTTDGRVCRFDGSVGLQSNGVDPSFNKGYAQTPGGTDYLYYDGHNGWDYALAYENVLAAADGTVRLAGTDSINPCFGQTIIIDHANGFSTRYAHLSAIYVTVGQAVGRGQVIAQSGNTGCSSGPHLHFGVYITSSWTAIDPWGWAGAPGADPWPADPGNLWLTGYGQFPLPWAPSNVSAVAGGASAVVTWTPPGFDGGTGLSSYIVTTSPGGATVSVPGTATSATVTGLSNGTAYTFTVTALNRVGAGPVSAASNVVTPRPQAFHAMFTMDGYGGLHAADGSSTPSGFAYWPGQRMARATVLLPSATGGYVLDAYGLLHAFAAGANPAPAAVTDTTTWIGWDIARDAALLPTSTADRPQGYTLDGYGGLHPFGGAPAARASVYWPGWDIARRVAILGDGTGGYVLDGYGGIHPFAVGTNPMPPAITVSAYWPGWDIARDLALAPGSTAANVAGVTLDGYGGVHQFGSAPAVAVSAYWPGWDIARAVKLAPTSSPAAPAGWVMDGYGGLHSFGGAPAINDFQYWPGWDIAVEFAVQ